LSLLFCFVCLNFNREGQENIGSFERKKEGEEEEVEFDFVYLFVLFFILDVSIDWSEVELCESDTVSE
jgi:hypothetical protein